jgi:membrane protein YdbS with pleckstrin-like domain
MVEGQVDSEPGTLRGGAGETLRGVFWTLAIAVIAGYVFFAVVVGFSITDALGATLLVAALAILWIVHAVVARRNRYESERDPRMREARSRRGF